ncbi:MULTISPECIES: hypothetical protein [unclassified Gordonia (in: high G+C Gram-positive bacteria)]|uniref:hypothetical protein n=1 Tax=unclassified Gordonia (in: high G+C Gram-positive bacteria) TaxID=2657482 RepID=UPI001FFE31C3|nr:MULTISPECIES: hypothetical protein [unclassified Gordonia (in: high G+C Gram-positive bacteria)]UQE76653.1 hypothetical protein MYK68_08880 [Gordonia sp. PP30]
MTAHDPGFGELDIVTEYGTVTRLPTSFPLIDPELDDCLDPDLFQKGFEDSLADLDALPVPWARHYASTTLAQAPDPDADEPSHLRGYRAGLYGFLRQNRN